MPTTLLLTPHNFQTFLRHREARQDQEAGITASLLLHTTALHCKARTLRREIMFVRVSSCRAYGLGEAQRPEVKKVVVHTMGPKSL